MFAKHTLIPPLTASSILAGLGHTQNDNVRLHVNAAGGSPASDKFTEYPRYYLNTNDTLIRHAEDGTPHTPSPNGANAGITPGLSKNYYVTRVFSVNNCAAVDLQAYLLRAVAYGGGIVEVMADPEVKDGAGNPVQFLFVTAPDFMIGGIEQAIEEVDLPGFKFSDGTGVNTYIGKHRTAGELKALRIGGELGNVGAFYYAPLADPTTNMLYYSDSPTDMPANLALLESFDRPPLQAEFEIVVYEIDDDELSDLGLDWDAWKRSLTGSLSYSSFGTGTQISDADIDSYDTLLSIDAATLADFLNFLTKDGSAKVSTRSRILSVNAEDNPGALSDGNKGRATANPAVLRSVRLLPYSVYHHPSVSPDGVSPGARTLQDVIDPGAFEGGEISVLPYIGSESITAEVQVSVNSLVGTTRESNIPNIASRQTRNVMTMKSGTTHLIGSFDKQTSAKTRLGVPLLKEVPVMKHLFSRETTTERTNKLVVLISPVIVSPEAPSDAAKVATAQAAPAN